MQVDDVHGVLLHHDWTIQLMWERKPWLWTLLERDFETLFPENLSDSR